VATLFRDLSAGNLSLADLWAPHNEHRWYFPHHDARFGHLEGSGVAVGEVVKPDIYTPECLHVPVLAPSQIPMPGSPV
jgi:hypothetical protein